MSSEITEDERILFRHSAEYYNGKAPKQKFARGAGDLLLSTHRVFFQSAGGGMVFETVWSNIAQDQYSPGSDARVMFLLSVSTALSTTNGENALFLLTGNDNLRNALEDNRGHDKNK